MSITPDAMLDSESFNARPMASPAAPSTAITDVVGTPSDCSAATMTMADAMVKANSADPKKYLPVLAKITHDGVTGKISFDSKGDINGGNLTLYTYKGGNKSQIAVVK